MIRYTVHFSGRVQGVGFRATVTSLAERFAAAGVVENLPDGRVRLIAEGDAEQLDGLVEAIRGRMARYVRDAQVDRSAANGEFGAPAAGGISVRY